jgi:hypothetical protein
MMHIVVERIKSTDDATLSIIQVNGKFECFGLEDEYREFKVMHETRIPQGIYKVHVREFGGHHARYSRKYPSWHKGMLQVMDVNGFTDILIHKGNTDEDTSGCLLVGQGCHSGHDLTISNSARAYEALYKKVIDAAINKVLTIEYRDLDR